jgi:hypothetical protein
MRALFAFGKFELPISYPWGPVLFETTERFDEERTQETQEQSGLKSAREVGTYEGEYGISLTFAVFPVVLTLNNVS